MLIKLVIIKFKTWKMYYKNLENLKHFLSECLIWPIIIRSVWDCQFSEINFIRVGQGRVGKNGWKNSMVNLRLSSKPFEPLQSNHPNYNGRINGMYIFFRQMQWNKIMNVELNFFNEFWIIGGQNCSTIFFVWYINCFICD